MGSLPMRVAPLLVGALQCHCFSLVHPACNATLHTGMSVGGNAYKTFNGGAAECCAACVADPKCAAFVTSTSTRGDCFLKADLSGPHAKAPNNPAIVRRLCSPPAPPGPAPGALAPGSPP
mgnify:CR=1 FL=1